MKKLNLLSVLIIYIFCISCNKDKNESQIQISGITETDITGILIGSVDTTDWRFNDTWNQNVENLFIKNNNEPTDKVLPQSYLAIGYPNPSKSIMEFYFHSDSSMYYDFRIVDSNLKVIIQLDSLKSGFALQGDTKFAKGILYRLYYKIYSTNKVYRGHGDFEFIN